MDYKKIGTEYYIRIDKKEAILDCILNICKRENIKTANFRGIGGCGKINIQTYVAEKMDFISHDKTGIFELISLDGNVSPEDNGDLAMHAHASFSYLEDGEIRMIGGHLKEAVVEYTAEIILVPAVKNIKRMICPKTGIGIWKLN